MLKSWKYLCVVLILVVAAGLAGCGSHDAPVMSEDAIRDGLVGKTWTLVRVVAREIRGEEPLTMQFHPDGKVEGFGGCNKFTGQYTLDGDKLQFGPFASTHMSCGPAADEREFTFLTILPKVQRLKVEGDNLTLITESQGEIELTSGSGSFW